METLIPQSLRGLWYFLFRVAFFMIQDKKIKRILIILGKRFVIIYTELSREGDDSV